jgi:hypothetical protein
MAVSHTVDTGSSPVWGKIFYFNVHFVEIKNFVKIQKNKKNENQF